MDTNVQPATPGTSRVAWLLIVAVLGYLWFTLIAQIRLEWAILPQYSYGWAVPFLCAYLIWRRLQIRNPKFRPPSSSLRLLPSDLRPPASALLPPSSVVRISASPWPVKSLASGMQGIFHRATSPGSFQLLFSALAFLYFLVRLIQAANPVWSLVSWGLALSVIGITLCLLRLAFPSPRWGEGGRGPDEVFASPPWEKDSSLAGAGDAPRPSDGRGWHNVTGEGYHRTSEGICRTDEVPRLSAFQRFSVSVFPFKFQHYHFSDFLFPLCFFLVAVPWPSVIENPLIQWLTRADARAAVELLGWFGFPVVQHGNVIEVATGTVGIDEACSGIRSFQATLMISLFLGDYYRLSVVRRTVLCLSGFALSFVFNLARMSLLVWVAARKGIDAISTWHDPAGVTILLACFFTLSGLGWLFARSTRVPRVESGVPPDSSGLTTSTVSPPPATDYRPLTSDLRPSVSVLRPPWRVKFVSLTSPGRPLASLTSVSLALAIWILFTEIGVASWYRLHEAHLLPAREWTIAHDGGAL